MRKQERVNEIIRLFIEHYTDRKICYLNYETDWQLLFATIMSAQCTDNMVNKVTKVLFVKYPTIEAFAQADPEELMQDIRPTGFYRNKAGNIKLCAKALLEKYDGIVPSDIEELTSLPGVGRKTANVIRVNIFHEDGVVVDTHVGRISVRLGITVETDPVKAEFALMKVLPKEYWSVWNTWLMRHGRSICTSQNPKCDSCFLKEACAKRKYQKR